MRGEGKVQRSISTCCRHNNQQSHVRRSLNGLGSNFVSNIQVHLFTVNSK
jgi:hypothetical protein